MRRRILLTKVLALALPVGAGTAWSVAAATGALDETQAASGIRAALERGVGAAVDQLGRTDGFLADPKVRIELPGGLDQAARLMRMTGQGRQVDELITAMNRAAEAAVPQARTLLMAAVRSMSVDDARRILAGGEGSVTRFFAGKTREPLSERFLPIVEQHTGRLAVTDQYNAVAGQVAGFGLLDQRDANVGRYVTAKALDGLYLMIAEEERRIRADPLGSGSAILKQVFGGLR